MKKYWILLFILVLFSLPTKFGLAAYLNLHYLKSHLNEIHDYYHSNPFVFSALYFALYVFVTAFSFPVATVLTLLGGAVFGFVQTVILVSFASTIGATLAFLTARFLFRDFFQRKFKMQFEAIKSSVKRDGKSYLLTLRLIPVFPFFLVNILMGLTTMRTSTFFGVSQLGMLPATIVYVYAGKSLAKINSLGDILSPEIITIFFLLGLLPYIAKSFLNRYKLHKLYKRFKRPKHFDFNMIVIGGGSAGLVTAYISNLMKAKVALIEKHKMGGDCLNTGCIPSKALIQSSKAVALKNQAAELGIKKIEIEFDFETIMERIQKVIAKIEPNDSAQRYQALGVECLQASAKILSPFEVEVDGKILTTQNITVATGASPAVPAISGMEKVSYLTSDTFWNLKTLPKKFLIIGGGPIGCEIAQAMNRLGSKVTIVESGKELLGKEDSDVGLYIEKKFIEEEIDIFFYAHAREFVVEDGLKYLLVDNLGKEIKLEFDEVLFAMGRKANVSGLGLEEVGVLLRENGTIETNAFMETNYPNIFACGDVTGPYQLTHMAAHQAWYCAINSLFGKFKKFPVDYKTVSWCTYTDPEVATVGLNEKALKEKQMEYETTFYDLSELDRAVVDGKASGFVKVMTVKGKDKILGATIVSVQASTMILEFVSAMRFKKGLNDILNTIHAYPTMGEANKYAAGVWKKNHAPGMILRILQKYFEWTRK